MKVKQDNTVVIGPIHPATHHAMNVVDRVWRKVMEVHPIITGLSEEGHSEGSLHYGIEGDVRLRAFDVRCHGLFVMGDAKQKQIHDELTIRLGAPHEYQIIWETPESASFHMHVEYDPTP